MKNLLYAGLTHWEEALESLFQHALQIKIKMELSVILNAEMGTQELAQSVGKIALMVSLTLGLIA
jgi:hypothetical protein